MIAVTGILPGGVSGKQTKKGGLRKDTGALNYNEYYTKQPTRYIYPLLKAHKLTLEYLREISSNVIKEKGYSSTLDSRKS